MSHKRTQHHSSTSFNHADHDDHDDKPRKTFRSFSSVVLEVMRQKNFQDALEPMLRKVVKEEVESAIKKYVVSLKRDSEEDVFCCELRNLQLKFLSTLSLPVFTGSRIEAEDGSAIKVALIDAATEEVVQYAPESCAKVELVVLEGDFDGDEGENWRIEEFNNNIVKEREGKKPLLTGEVHIYLKEGTGSVSEISFTDNSSWTRSRKFRLGARVIGDYDGARIREAKTESFIVRDHRGELYKKHHPPNLSDEVWRLEKIGKDGAFHKRLTSERVQSVKDFLIFFHLDPARLKKILGSGMSAKMWEVTVEHAQTCVLDKKVYLYYAPVSQHKNGVVFNVVGQLMGFYSESQFVPIDKLPENDKIDSQRMVIEAFQHLDRVIPYDDMNSLIDMTKQAERVPMTETSDGSKRFTSQTVNRIDCGQPSISSPDSFSPFYPLGCLSTPDDFSLQAMDALDVRYDHSPNIPIQISNTLDCSSHSMNQSFSDVEDLGFKDIDYYMQSDNASLVSHADVQSVRSDFVTSHTSGDAVRVRGQRRWRVLWSILRAFPLRRLLKGGG